MTRAALIAVGAVSALGEGAAAASAGEVGARARVVIAQDAELRGAGFARPFAARVAGVGDGGDRATLILQRALDACARELDEARPAWRTERVGLVLGTSSGGMRSAERFFDAGEFAEQATYFAPMVAAARALGIPLAPTTLVLGACASSTIAIGLGMRWLDQGACDLVLVGGFDAVSVFVAAGFEVLRATSARVPPSPFRVGRDGMALGEGAAVLALTRGDRAPARAYFVGFGASADAVHLTAPDREGGGLARAASAALADAGLSPDAVDLVSAHATATPFNDPAEARAISRVLGARARDVVVHPMKAQIGHTLGAAGALEALACVDALQRGVLPAAAGEGELDPDAAVRLLDVGIAGTPRAALKLSSAFGGANAALVITHHPGSSTPRARHTAYVTRAFHVSAPPDIDVLAARLGWVPGRLARVDTLTLLALAAVAEVRDRFDLAGAGMVVGHALATIETNALFQARIRERGARFAEPRRFPYTSPNAVAGECSLAFGCTGPSFAVGGGPHGAIEALATAALLVESGDAEGVVVVASDEVGEAAASVARALGFELTQGAVATLVTREPSGCVARITRSHQGHSPEGSLHGTLGAHGHRALLPLTAEPVPTRLASSLPPDVVAFVDLEPIPPCS